MIHKLSVVCAKKIISVGQLQSISEPVLCYGCELIITSIIGLFILILLSLLIGHPLAWVFFVIGFAPQRTSSGGYHADTHIRCYMATSAMFLLSTSVAYGLTWNSFIYLVISIFSSIFVLLLAPVAATNKPLSPKRYRTNRIRSLVLISINLVLAILLLWLNIVIRAANMYYSGIFFAALSLIIGKAKISLKGGNNSEG